MDSAKELGQEIDALGQQIADILKRHGIPELGAEVTLLDVALEGTKMKDCGHVAVEMILRFIDIKSVPKGAVKRTTVIENGNVLHHGESPKVN